MMERAVQFFYRVMAVIALLAVGTVSAAAAVSDWDMVVAKARGQTVLFNAWAGDPQTNAFIASVAREALMRYGIKVKHTKLSDTAEAVARVVAEKAAGRHAGGSVDLIWINGPHFLAMKSQNLLFGPFSTDLPNARYVDTTSKPSNVTDFTVPVDGFESPWRMAQLVFLYDSARAPLDTVPKTIPAFLPWAQANPGRFAHPHVRDFLGVTFLKQALYELAPDPKALQEPATDENFAVAVAPLWRWYDALKPLLWRHGAAYPETGAALLQLLADGELDLTISFNPAEAAVGIGSGLLPQTVRVYVLAKGTIGNTSFVAIPYNAAHKEGAMVLANLLLSPEIQARAQDPKAMGSFTVLDLAKLDAAQRELFKASPSATGLPTNAELGITLPEPHPSWMNRLTQEWERRYVK